MGTGVDPYTIVVIILTIPPAIHATVQLTGSIIRWKKHRERKISFKTEVKNADNDIKQKINAKLEEICQKRDTKKHNSQ